MTTIDLTSVSHADGVRAAYPDAAAASVRLTALCDAFATSFGRRAEWVARAPGRVNLIGEHVDYSGYSVLPMAVAQDVAIAGALRTDGVLRVRNVHGTRFAECQIGLRELLDASDIRSLSANASHVWHWYVFAGVKGALVKGGVDAEALARSGADLLVDGRVPMGSGLSSSSAVVCASFIAALRVTGARGISTREQCADATAWCERFVGVQSGGMDQAISFLGELGAAKLIRFVPMGSTTVRLPPNAVFVIANSLEESNKAITAKQNYNKRVIECRLAATLLASRAGHLFAPKYDTILRDAVRDVTNNDHSLATLHAAIVRQFALTPATQHCAYLRSGVAPHARLVSINDACAAVAALTGQPLAVDAFVAAVLPAGLLTPDEYAAAIYNPLDRLLHVVGEAMRVPLLAGVAQLGASLLDAPVDQVLTIADDGAFQLSADAAKLTTGADSDHQRLVALGRLMNESQRSCHELYQCSCDSLERLVRCAREAGALGARLTGAGWGGCTVLLLDANTTPPAPFLESLKKSYYAPLALSDAQFAETAFVTGACGGACLMNM
jgi:N-acetylgalactosamine kinase